MIDATGALPAMPDEAQPTEEGTVVIRPPRHRVERRAILLWTLNWLVAAVLVAGGLGVAYASAESYRPWIGPLLVLAVIGSAVNLTVTPTARYLVHRWECTELAVYSLKGWLLREWRVAPVSRIQTVDTVKGPFEQLLGLATLKVTTASREGGIRIPGLDAATAAEAAQRLTEITQRSHGDAT